VREPARQWPTHKRPGIGNIRQRAAWNILAGRRNRAGGAPLTRWRPQTSRARIRLSPATIKLKMEAGLVRFGSGLTRAFSVIRAPGRQDARPTLARIRAAFRRTEKLMELGIPQNMADSPLQGGADDEFREGTLDRMHRRGPSDGALVPGFPAFNAVFRLAARRPHKGLDKPPRQEQKKSRQSDGGGIPCTFDSRERRPVCLMSGELFPQFPAPARL